MLTAREIVDALSRLDENTPVMTPSVVGFEESKEVKLRQVCFRGSFAEPGEWIEKEHADPAAVSRGVLTVAVIE